MNILKKACITAVSAAMLISSVSCLQKDKNEIESELEKKYSRDFSYISKTEEEGSTYLDESNNVKREGNTIIYRFEDEDGIEFEVKCLDKRTLVDSYYYSDNYEDAYFKVHSDEYLSDAEKAGIKAYYAGKGVIKINIDNYDQIGDVINEANKLRQRLKNEFSYGDSFINSDTKISAPIIMFYHDYEKVAYDSRDEEQLKSDYIQKIKEGKINEKLPEGV